VTAKSVLLGQYPITRIPYEKIWCFKTFAELVELLKKLPHQKKPNYETREYWIEKLNKFPFLFSFMKKAKEKKKKMRQKEEWEKFLSLKERRFLKWHYESMRKSGQEWLYDG
jgi:hypothetical protein